MLGHIIASYRPSVLLLLFLVLTLIRLLGIMLENIMINPRSIKTIPKWNVVTMDSDLSGGALTTSSSSVPTLATLSRLLQITECPAPATPTPLSRLILLSLLWCLFSLSILTAMALCMAEVSGILTVCWVWSSLDWGSGEASCLICSHFPLPAEQFLAKYSEN